MSGDPEHLAGNRRSWTEHASFYEERALEQWHQQPHWGIWQIPETEVELLPADLNGVDCIEIGCGTAYVSAWMQQRGGRPVGLDPTPAQLKTARRMQAETGIHFPLIEACGERIPLADDSFDFAISEYGAALWADPREWIPEARRVLRTGGRLVYMTNSPLMVMTLPDGADAKLSPTLVRPYFDNYRVTYSDEPDSTEFHPTHGETIEILLQSGFVLERLIELRAPAGSTTAYDWADLDWATRWPTEDVWVARAV